MSSTLTSSSSSSSSSRTKRNRDDDQEQISEFDPFSEKNKCRCEHSAIEKRAGSHVQVLSKFLHGRYWICFPCFLKKEEFYEHRCFLCGVCSPNMYESMGILEGLPHCTKCLTIDPENQTHVDIRKEAKYDTSAWEKLYNEYIVTASEAKAILKILQSYNLHDNKRVLKLVSKTSDSLYEPSDLVQLTESEWTELKKPAGSFFLNVHKAILILDHPDFPSRLYHKIMSCVRSNRKHDAEKEKKYEIKYLAANIKKCVDIQDSVAEKIAKRVRETKKYLNRSYEEAVWFEPKFDTSGENIEKYQTAENFLLWMSTFLHTAEKPEPEEEE